MLYGQIDTFSCGHIIPAENLCVLAVSRGPQDKPLNFRYDSRSDEVVCDAWWRTICSLTDDQTLRELSQSVVNICQIVDDGVVIFFPSYGYEEAIYADWQKRGTLAALEVKLPLNTPLDLIAIRKPRRSSESHAEPGVASTLCWVHTPTTYDRRLG